MKLKPCPFCGSKKAEHVEGSYTIDGVETTTRNVLCGNCNAMGPDTLFGEDIAAAKWNRRRSPRRRKLNKNDVPTLAAGTTNRSTTPKQ